MEALLCGDLFDNATCLLSLSPRSVLLKPTNNSTGDEQQQQQQQQQQDTYTQEFACPTGMEFSYPQCSWRRTRAIDNAETTVVWCVDDDNEEKEDPILLEEPPLVRMLSRDNLDTTMHVLTQGIIEALQDNLPWSKRGEAFWLQYSLVRDGASLDTLLDKIKDTKYSLLAIETTDGEVFGAFVGHAWQRSTDFFGTGESFLWRMPMQRSSSFDSSLDGTERDVHLDIFSFAYQNYNVQLVEQERLIVGGGTHPDDSRWGFGLCMESDLLRGSTAPCLTFDSPSLSVLHRDGSTFDVRNIEAWTLTPHATVEAAEQTYRKRNLLARAGLIPKKLLSFRRRGRRKKDQER